MLSKNKLISNLFLLVRICIGIYFIFPFLMDGSAHREISFETFLLLIFTLITPLIAIIISRVGEYRLFKSLNQKYRQVAYVILDWILYFTIIMKFGLVGVSIISLILILVPFMLYPFIIYYLSIKGIQSAITSK